MSTQPCARCNAPTAPNALSMSLDGNGMICPACSIAAKAVQEKAGMKKAYISGAFIVGLVFLYFASRVFVRLMH